MKYFSIQDWKTDEPWDRIQADRQRYREYLETIRPHLPPDLSRLYDFSPGWNESRLSLHDCQVHHINASYESQTVMFVLCGGYNDAEGRQAGLRRFTLTYRGVTGFEVQDSIESAYNPGPDWEPQAESPTVHTFAGITFDDYGWGEIELVEDTFIEHRMLFASGTETIVRFRGFTLETVDTPHSKATE